MGAWSLHLDEDRVTWSPELEDVFGIPRGSFAGTQAAFHAMVYPADLPRLQQEIARSLATGEEYCVIFRYQHSSGEWRWMGEREDSPWYPTMRLFRQKIRNDWPETIARVAQALRARR